MTLEKKEFPINTQIGIFENEKDIEQWLLKQDGSYPHDYAAFIKASQVIYTPQIAEYLLRSAMQTEFNIYSYSQNFDEIPADYIDMLLWINQCKVEAAKEKQRLGR